MTSNSKMYNYICETPTVLKGILDRRKEISKSFVDCYKEVPIEQIYIIGSGTSYHAGLAAKAYLEELLNMKVIPMYPTHFERSEKVYNKNTLVIGVSQGGQSLSTVAGLDSAKEKGLHTAAVSENPTALIFDHAEANIRIEVNNEQCGAKTKGYAGTIMTLMVMMTELALAKTMVTKDTVQPYFDRMTTVIRNLERVTQASVSWFDRIKNDFLPAKRIIVVGYDNIYADVLEGALKILETVRQGVSGYDIEEFFHGIYNSISEDSYLFYLGSKSDYKPRTLKLIEILREWTPHNYLIASPEGVNASSDRDLICNFVDDPLFSVWEYIIPIQIVACFASQELGINPDIPKDPKFHERIGSKKLDGVRDNYTVK